MSGIYTYTLAIPENSIFLGIDYIQIFSKGGVYGSQVLNYIENQSVYCNNGIQDIKVDLVKLSDSEDYYEAIGYYYITFSK